MTGLKPLIKLGDEEIQCLLPEHLVTGVVISAYLRLIDRRSSYCHELPIVYCFDTVFFEDYLKGGFPLTKRRALGVRLFDHDILLFPLHVQLSNVAYHWALIEARSMLNTVTYDSMKFDRTQELNIVLEFLHMLAMEEGHSFDQSKWTLYQTPKSCPQQTDDTSCGLYICAFADAISTGIDVGELVIDQRKWRCHLYHAIRRGRLGDNTLPLIDVSEDVHNSLRCGPSSLGRARRARLCGNTSNEPTETIDLTDDSASSMTYTACKSNQKSATNSEQSLTEISNVEFFDHMEEINPIKPQRSCSPPTYVFSKMDLGKSNMPEDMSAIKHLKEDLTSPPDVSTEPQDPKNTSGHGTTLHQHRYNKRIRKYFSVRRWQSDGSFYREKFLKPQYGGTTL